MSAPFFEPYFEIFSASAKVIPLAVLGASLLGSGHCVAMCGGLVSMVAKTPRATASYHLARLTGYCVLGALAGFVGQKVLQPSHFALIPWIATLSMALMFILLGVRTWSGKPPHVFRMSSRLFNPISRFLGRGPAATGFLSALLPCGWLHTFVLGAVATQSPILGATYLFLFWLGTLPALGFAGVLINRIFAPIRQSAPRLSAVILITVGLASIGMKMMPALSSARSPGGAAGEPQEASCHHGGMGIAK
ncbi:MAG: sulfite exporter TauE/SafE family protein [Methylotenera sp.]|nr:sulfite exporter TauE/SafE family protein [Oligoflexia bacterium]